MEIPMRLQNTLSARLLMGLFAASSLAQEPHTAEQRAHMFNDYLVKRAAQITRNNLADIKDLSEWKLRRPIIRKQMLYMLGLDPMPGRTPLHARITGQ